MEYSKRKTLTSEIENDIIISADKTATKKHEKRF